MADSPLGVDAFKVHVEAPQPRDMLEHFLRVVVQWAVVVLRVPQREGAVAAQVDAPHLNVGLAVIQVVLA